VVVFFLGYEEDLTIEMCMPLMAPRTLGRPHQALNSFITTVKKAKKLNHCII
jgi:hypothetical protein